MRVHRWRGGMHGGYVVAEDESEVGRSGGWILVLVGDEVTVT